MEHGEGEVDKDDRVVQNGLREAECGVRRGDVRRRIRWEDKRVK